jgi:glycerophosphoryl diester phosphodiesterase
VTRFRSATKPLVIAHRGASGLAPENTLAAFQLAVDLGADGIELDVQLAADGQPVIIHDQWVDRTTNASGAVGDWTSSQLSMMDASSWFNRRLRAKPRLRAEVNAISLGISRDGSNGASVPTLDAALRLFSDAGLKRVYLELKGRPARTRFLLPRVIELVRRYRLHDVVTVIAFDHRLVEQSGLAGIRAGALFALGRPGSVRADAIARKARQVGAAEAALHLGLATPRTVDALHAHGITVSVWTVNSRLMLRRLAASGVDAIMTNFPNRLITILSEPQAERKPGLGRRRLRLGRWSGR